jgi:hypothetical protein
MLAAGGSPDLRKLGQKLAAVAAIVALLLSGLAGLGETLSAADLPACCNTAYCPLHHHTGRSLQKDKSDCGAMGAPGQNSCSMRGCDAAPNPIVSVTVFLLEAPFALRGPNVAETAPAASSFFFSDAVLVPSPPPPRTFLS